MHLSGPLNICYSLDPSKEACLEFSCSWASFSLMEFFWQSMSPQKTNAACKKG
jgi:hypothetical protein